MVSEQVTGSNPMPCILTPSVTVALSARMIPRDDQCRFAKRGSDHRDVRSEATYEAYEDAAQQRGRANVWIL